MLVEHFSQFDLLSANALGRVGKFVQLIQQFIREQLRLSVPHTDVIQLPIKHSLHRRAYFTESNLMLDKPT